MLLPFLSFSSIQFFTVRTFLSVCVLNISFHFPQAFIVNVETSSLPICCHSLNVTLYTAFWGFKFSIYLWSSEILLLCLGRNFFLLSLSHLPFFFNLFSLVSILCVCVCVCLLSCVQLFVTLFTEVHKAPLSIEFSRQEYWRVQPCPSRRIFPPRGWTRISCVSCIGTQILHHCATWEALSYYGLCYILKISPLSLSSSQICSLPLSNLLINPCCSDFVFGYFYRLIFKIYFQTIILDFVSYSNN